MKALLTAILVSILFTPSLTKLFNTTSVLCLCVPYH